MKTLNFLIVLSGVALAGLGISSGAQAAILLPSLTPGSQYRLVFVTSGLTNATSTNIADYNTFVNTAAQSSTVLSAALNSAGFAPSAINWTAIGSTATTNARVNTATQGNGGVPIYRLDGAVVAATYLDLWDGSIGASISVDEVGNESLGLSNAWTGTNGIGTTFLVSPLGERRVTLGHILSVESGFWVNVAGSTTASFLPQRLYGISSILTVPALITTPEPSSLLSFITLGGLMLGSAFQKARK